MRIAHITHSHHPLRLPAADCSPAHRTHNLTTNGAWNIAGAHTHSKPHSTRLHLNITHAHQIRTGQKEKANVIIVEVLNDGTVDMKDALQASIDITSANDVDIIPGTVFKYRPDITLALLTKTLTGVFLRGDLSFSDMEIKNENSFDMDDYIETTKFLPSDVPTLHAVTIRGCEIIGCSSRTVNLKDKSGTATVYEYEIENPNGEGQVVVVSWNAALDDDPVGKNMTVAYASIQRYNNVTELTVTSFSSVAIEDLSSSQTSSLSAASSTATNIRIKFVDEDGVLLHQNVIQVQVPVQYNELLREVEKVKDAELASSNVLTIAEVLDDGDEIVITADICEAMVDANTSLKVSLNHATKKHPHAHARALALARAPDPKP